MKIESDFKDYYDVGMSQGQDQSLVYSRFTKRVVPSRYPFVSWFGRTDDGLPWFYGSPSLYTDQFMIGFCGRLYPVIELNDPEVGHLQNDKKARSGRVFCYNITDVDTFMRHRYPKDYGIYCSTGYQKGSRWNPHQRRRDFERFFEVCNESRDQAGKYFQDNYSPIFVGHSSRRGGVEEKWIDYNCCLKKYEFYRIFDSYSAYQEIAMWLANQAVPLKPIPEIDDKTMAEIKGFDKFSFRKDKKSG